MSVKLTELREPLLEAKDPRLEARDPLLLPEDMVRVLADRLQQVKKENKKGPFKYNYKHHCRHKKPNNPDYTSSFTCIQYRDTEIKLGISRSSSCPLVLVSNTASTGRGQVTNKSGPVPEDKRSNRTLSSNV